MNKSKVIKSMFTIAIGFFAIVLLGIIMKYFIEIIFPVCLFIIVLGLSYLAGIAVLDFKEFIMGKWKFLMRKWRKDW